MAGLAEYLSYRLLPFAFVVLIGTVILIFFLHIIHVVFRRTIKPSRLLIISALMALVIYVPQMIFECLWLYPDLINHVVGGALIYPLPLLLLPNYWLMRRLLGFSPTTTVMTLGELMSGQYMAMLLYNLLNTLLMDAYLLDLSIANLLAMIGVCVISALASLCITIYVKKTDDYDIEFPDDYRSPNVRRELVRIVLHTATDYALLIMVSLLLFGEHGRFELDDALVYAIILSVLIYRMSDNIHKRKLVTLARHEQTTSQYVQSLAFANEEFRTMKHDFYNLLQVYDGFIAVGDMAGLREYHTQLSAATTSAGTAFYLAQSVGTRTALHALLDIKRHNAERLSVRMDYINVGLLTDVRMSDLDLCRVLGNLLDNAIEAAAETDERWVHVQCMRVDGRVRVLISNASATRINKALFCEPGYTTKPMHAGQGLRAVMRIMAKHECSPMEIHSRDREVVCSLLLDAQSGNLAC